MSQRCNREVKRVDDPFGIPACFFWTVDEVADWIESIGYGKYKENFRSHFINGKKLLTVDSCVLPKMGITHFGDILSLAKATQRMGTSLVSAKQAKGTRPSVPSKTPSHKVQGHHSCAGTNLVSTVQANCTRATASSRVPSHKVQGHHSCPIQDCMRTLSQKVQGHHSCPIQDCSCPIHDCMEWYAPWWQRPCHITLVEFERMQNPSFAYRFANQPHRYMAP